MFKVLLIDDEPIIREGLETIIDWSQHGFEICGEAANGRDGLEKVRHMQPDLLIVDIKMPVIDGLKLLEELRKEGNQVQALILTGYSEFAYAQKAVNLGAIGYILKPIDEDDLSTNVKKAYNEIVKGKKAQKFDHHKLSLISDYLAENRPDGVIQRITDYIQRNYYQDLKLVTLARFFNYNPDYLGKLFKSHTGENFRSYLSRIRLQEARKMLIKGAKVSDSARKVGYEDLDYFNQKFKEYYGIVPSACKKPE